MSGNGLSRPVGNLGSRIGVWGLGFRDEGIMRNKV